MTFLAQNRRLGGIGPPLPSQTRRGPERSLALESVRGAARVPLSAILERN